MSGKRVISRKDITLPIRIAVQFAILFTLLGFAAGALFILVRFGD